MSSVIFVQNYYYRKKQVTFVAWQLGCCGNWVFSFKLKSCFTAPINKNKICIANTSYFMQICDYTNLTAEQMKRKEPLGAGYGKWRELTIPELKVYYSLRSFIELFCKDG